MVRGTTITPAQKRQLLAKIRLARKAEDELADYVAELSEAGVSFQSMQDATGERGQPLHINHSTLHRMAKRSRGETP